ncbi:hypothetical protein MVES_001839 [Malassezia vespertilionis]|uniref:Uncharacterized protein n=1 Tax=Malassezia vespertilionis TaxID=2020962 RepID=A0A2N1JCH9_9BASI|nr:hypothetical protein MVES_001839 [Malassezia vespertilionis]
MTAPGDDVIGQVLVVSGGSGYNELVGATPNAIFVLPVSDDGGSSSEIERTPTLSNPLGGFDPVGEVPTLGAQSDSDESDQDEAQSTYESAVLPPHGEPTLGKIAFSKFDSTVGLPSPIQRIFYVNAFRNEVCPVANPAYILGLNRSKMLVYSCGSLWTSIIPCLALRGIATAIAKSPTLEHKVLLLNASHDRETQGMDALDFVHAICNSLNNVDTEQKATDGYYPIHSLLTHIVYLRQGTIPIPKDKLEQVGIRCIAVDTESQEDPKLGERIGYDLAEENECAQQIPLYLRIAAVREALDTSILEHPSVRKVSSEASRWKSNTTPEGVEENMGRHAVDLHTLLTLVLESAPSTRKFMQEMETCMEIEQRDMINTGDLEAYTSLSPRINAQLDEQKARTARTQALQKDTFAFLQQYNDYVDQLSKVFLALDASITRLEKAVTQAEARRRAL